jgi:hypothetical protein
MSAIESTHETAAGKANLALIQGDLSKLTELERYQYYQRVCASVGLNPETKPFGYISFQGKLILYATRNATDQLRAIHGVSLVSHEIKESDGVLFATVTLRDRHGRTDTDVGAVTVKGLQGDSRANAYMKCLTKAKRRATLSLCGLSTLDETEMDTMPGASVVDPAASAPIQQVLEVKAEGMKESARERGKALKEFTELYNSCKEKLPADHKEYFSRQFGVTSLKDCNLAQLANLIDYVATYARDMDAEEGE